MSMEGISCVISKAYRPIEGNMMVVAKTALDIAVSKTAFLAAF